MKTRFYKQNRKLIKNKNELNAGVYFVVFCCGHEMIKFYASGFFALAIARHKDQSGYFCPFCYKTLFKQEEISFINHLLDLCGFDNVIKYYIDKYAETVYLNRAASNELKV